MSAPEIFDRALLVQRRDRAARGFDDVSYLVGAAMDDLLERLAFIKRDFRDVLVLGAHTGGPARALRRAMPDARVLEADASAAMLASCDGPSVLADEEALPFEREAFDCVIAPMTLHGVNDLPGALWQVQSILKPDGLLLGALLGGRTLDALAVAVMQAEAELTGGASPRVMPRIDVRQLGGLMQRAGFAMPVVDAVPLTVTYADPLRLMREIKAMGASNCLAGRARTPMTRGLLAAIAAAYQAEAGAPDGRVAATFEMLFMTGWAPHPDQPRALKPGSATHSLAEALGTREIPAGEKPGGA
ncbi:MAG: methyltransferase domain-containing protein [Pseudomonadota bacterium]